MKQKVAPAPQTLSAVMPMHSPQYNNNSNGQRLDTSFPRPFPYSYDPSFELPLSLHHPVSVAPVDPPVFQTPPKHHHPRNSAQPKSGGGRGTRRRRPPQPRISDVGVSLPSLGPATAASRRTSAVLLPSPPAQGDRQQWTRQGDDGSAQHMRIPPAPASVASHPHKSKRRSEQTPADANTELDRRLWKSPRGANDAAATRFARASLSDDGGCEQQHESDSGHWTSVNATAPESDELHCAEPHYVFAPPAPQLPT